MNRSRLGRVFAALLLVWPAATAAAQSPDELLKYVPAPVNTVAVVNVNAILTSPRATREGWAKKDHVEYLAGAVPVHPSVERILLAKELTVEAPGRGSVLAVLPLTKSLDIEKFAAARGGRVDTVSGESVAVTADGSVGVKLADKLLGLLRTDNRQEVSRWMKYAKAAGFSQQSKYLNAAVFNAGTRNHILIAVDTDDLFHPQQAGMAVAKSQTLAQDKPSAEAVEAFLGKLNGVRFAANMTADGIAAEIRFDSAVPLKGNPDFLKAFLMEVLDRHGIVFEDLRAAATKAEGNAVTMAFKLSDPELALVMSVITPPSQSATASDVLTVTPAGVNPDATRKYYQRVNKILDDLKAKNKKAQEYEKTALWHDTAANQIETLSVLNVDPAVVDFGVGTTARLRAIADSLRGVPVQVEAAAAEGYAFGYMPRVSGFSFRGGMRFNPWLAAGPQSIQTNMPEIMKKQSEAVKKDTANRGKVWDEIEKQRSDVRRIVATKSNIDLDAPGKK